MTHSQDGLKFEILKLWLRLLEILRQCQNIHMSINIKASSPGSETWPIPVIISLQNCHSIEIEKSYGSIGGPEKCSQLCMYILYDKLNSLMLWYAAWKYHISKCFQVIAENF